MGFGYGNVRFLAGGGHRACGCGGAHLDTDHHLVYVWCDFGDEKSYCGFEAFMPHRFSHYKSFILECQYRQQGGSVPF